MSYLLAIFLAWIPVQGASVVPPGQTSLTLGGGFAVVDLAVAGVILPVPSGEIELAHGLTDWLDVRARYSTHLGIIHRLGPELRAAFALDDSIWWLGVRAWTSASLVSSFGDQETTAGGTVDTQTMAMLTYRTAAIALSLELGASIEWLLWERANDETFVDDSPYLAYARTSIAVEWATSRSSSLFFRLDLAIPASPEPFTVLGTYPRLIFGGSLEP